VLRKALLPQPAVGAAYILYAILIATVVADMTFTDPPCRSRIMPIAGPWYSPSIGSIRAKS